MATKPSEFPDWATSLETDATSGQPNRDQPPTDKQESGYDFEESPPRQWINWKFWNIGNWTRWFNQREGEIQSDLDDAVTAIEGLTESEQVELLGDFDAGQYATFSRSGQVVAVHVSAGLDGVIDFTTSSNPTSSAGVVPTFARPQEGHDARIVYAMDIASNFIYEARVTHDGNFSIQIGEVTTGLTDTNDTSAPTPNFSYKVVKLIAAP